MVNTAPLAAMALQFEHLLAMCGAVLWGYPVGRLIKQWEIKRWAKR